MKYVPTEEWTAEQLETAIDNSLNRWNDIYSNGCKDPTWEDGVNLNLIRNHILYYCKVLERKAAEPLQMSLFDTDVSLEAEGRIPPIVDNKYMAKPEELRKNAEKCLEAILADENYNYILSIGCQLSLAQKKKVCYDNVIRYPESITIALNTSNYPRMRSFQNTENWIKSYTEIRTRIEEVLSKADVITISDDDDDYGDIAC